jgi:hypothetical protein
MPNVVERTPNVRVNADMRLTLPFARDGMHRWPHRE